MHNHLYFLLFLFTILSCTSEAPKHKYADEREELIDHLNEKYAGEMSYLLHLDDDEKKRLESMEGKMLYNEDKGMIAYLAETDEENLFYRLYDHELLKNAVNSKGYTVLDQLMIGKNDKYTQIIIKNQFPYSEHSFSLAYENLPDSTFSYFLDAYSKKIRQYEVTSCMNGSENLTVGNGKVLMDYAIKNAIDELNTDYYSKNWFELINKYTYDKTRFHRAGYTDLHLACFADDEERVVALANTAELSKRTPQGHSALYLVLKNGNINLVQNLIAKGAPMEKEMMKLGNSRSFIWDHFLKVEVADADSVSYADSLLPMYEYSTINYPSTVVINKPVDFVADVCKSFFEKSYRSVYDGDVVNFQLGSIDFWNQWYSSSLSKFDLLNTDNLPYEVLLAYSAYAVSKNSQLLHSLYKSQKSQFLEIIDTATYFKLGLKNHIDAYLTVYDKINPEEDGGKQLDDIYVHCDKNGLYDLHTLLNDETLEEYYEIIGFWARRQNDGTRELVYELLNDLKHKFEGVDFFDAHNLTIVDSTVFYGGSKVYICASQDSHAVESGSVFVVKSDQNSFHKSELIDNIEHSNKNKDRSTIELTEEQIKLSVLSVYEPPYKFYDEVYIDKYNEGGLVVDHFSGKGKAIYIEGGYRPQCDFDYFFENNVFSITDNVNEKRYVNDLIIANKQVPGAQSSPNFKFESKNNDESEFKATANFMWNDSAIIGEFTVIDDDIRTGIGANKDCINIYYNNSSIDVEADVDEETQYVWVQIFMENNQLVAKCIGTDDREINIPVYGGYAITENGYTLKFELPVKYCFDIDSLKENESLPLYMYIFDNNNTSINSNEDFYPIYPHTYGRMVLIRNGNKPVLNNRLFNLR